MTKNDYWQMWEEAQRQHRLAVAAGKSTERWLAEMKRLNTMIAAAPHYRSERSG